LNWTEKQYENQLLLTGGLSPAGVCPRLTAGR